MKRRHLDTVSHALLAAAIGLGLALALMHWATCEGLC
jgi:hypothetical protein